MTLQSAINTRNFLTSSFEEGARLLARHRNPILTAMFGLVFMLTSTGLAHADDNVTGGLAAETMLSNVCSFILGPFGKTLAVMGIIAIGLAWMFGRASLGLVAGVVGGIIIMFGASALGTMITG